MAVAAWFFPLLAVLLVAFLVRNPNFADVRTPLIVVGLIALVLLFVPALRYGLFGY